MPREQTLLAVDLSYQTYRAASSHSRLTSAEGLFTGGLYGFLVTLAKIIRDTEATRVVVCEDRKPYRRSELYPQYKQLRKASADTELRDQVNASKPLIVDALSVIGIPVLAVPGFESDDIIAHLVTQYRHRYKEIYAASNDSDLFQLFWCPRFKVYRKDDTDVMDARRLAAETGLSPEQFMLASALMGTHNDVEGIPRVGIKTSVAAVKDPGMLRMYRERHNNLIDRNLRLIKLPYEGFPRDLTIPGVTPFHHRALYRFCARYDITVTKSMLDSFEQVTR